MAHMGNNLTLPVPVTVRKPEAAAVAFRSNLARGPDALRVFCRTIRVSRALREEAIGFGTVLYESVHALEFDLEVDPLYNLNAVMDYLTWFAEQVYHGREVE